MSQDVVQAHSGQRTCAGKALPWLCAILVLTLSACSTQNFSSEAATQTVAARSRLKDGLYLKLNGELISLDAHILVGGKSIGVSDLPDVNERHPLVLMQASDDRVIEYFQLVRMVGGTGFRITGVDEAGGLLVGGAAKGHGAEAAGLQAGDVIVAVDGQELAQLPHEDDHAHADQVGHLIVGELGTTVQFTVQRGEDLLDLTVLRDSPTKLPDSKNWAFSREKTPEGYFELLPEEPLGEGLYCYWHYVPARMPGDFYCFIIGDEAFVEDMRSLADSSTPVARTPTVSKVLEPGGETRAVLEETECRFPTETDQDVLCADLLVPEDRSLSNGDTIRLHVAIWGADQAQHPDPVIHLHGGPGAPALEWAADAYWGGFQHLFPGRFFVVFDQRGTGYAQPRLNCPSQAEAYAQSLTEDQRLGLLEWEAGQMGDCLASLGAEGIDLAAYSTAASAADLHDLILALGYEQVNLYGSSYGTRLALAYLRDFGQEGRVRSVTLESVAPPQANLFTERAANAQRAFDAIFAAYAADPSCSAKYSDLEDVFYSLLEQLDAEPVTATVLNPKTGKEQDVVVNSHRLLETFYRAAYRANWIPKLPKMLHDMQAGNLDLFSSAAEQLFAVADSVDQSVYSAVRCNDEAAGSSPGMIESASEGLHPLLRAYFDGSSKALLQVCVDWDLQSTDLGQPVTSDVPVLILSGSFDPVTPPAYGTLAAETLRHGFVYEFPDASHSVVSASQCAQSLVYEFVQDPAEPRHECLGDLSEISLDWR